MEVMAAKKLRFGLFRSQKSKKTWKNDKKMRIKTIFFATPSPEIEKCSLMVKELLNPYNLFL